jgi:hypothetical protein
MSSRLFPAYLFYFDDGVFALRVKSGTQSIQKILDIGHFSVLFAEQEVVSIRPFWIAFSCQ